MNGADILRLNVGGQIYTTTRATLCKYPESMLGAMFKGDIPAWKDQHGCYFIDRDGNIFKYVLNFLRSSRLSLPKDFKDYDLLVSEADFYQIQPLIEAVYAAREEELNLTEDTHYLEVIEVRSGSTATMPTNNSRVKTVISGRKDVILSLPPALIGDEASERLNSKLGLDYVELELFGSNIRLRMAETLKNCNWNLVDSHLSSSSSLVTTSALNSTLFIEQTYRDRWSLSLPKIKKVITYM